MSDTETDQGVEQIEDNDTERKIMEGTEDAEAGSDDEYLEYYYEEESDTEEEIELVPAFTHEDRELIRHAFTLFDFDGDGVISAKELGTLLRALGQSPSEEELGELLIALDSNKNGVIEFEEFITLMEERIDTRTMAEDQKEAFREAFKVFDKDGSGKISAEELRAALTTSGKMRLTDEEADEMLRIADIDGDGQINYEEFVSLFTGVKIIQDVAEGTKTENAE